MRTSWRGAIPNPPQASLTARASNHPVKKGFDGAKNICGIKRHPLVDVLRLPIRVLVHDANVQDRDGIAILLQNIRRRHRRLKHLWVDGGYQGPRVQEVAERESLRIEVVEKPKDQKGFVVLPRRWVVERSFAWLEGARRLNKDHELLRSTQETWTSMRFVKIITNRLK